MAVKRITERHGAVKVSNIYETKPRIDTGESLYLNLCITFDTEMTCLEIMKYLSEVELWVTEKNSHSQFRQSSVDCDLISYGDEIVRTPNLTIPHPDAHRRAFVMIPLAEICPDWTHPILRKTARQLAEESQWPGWGTFFLDGNSLLDF
jgi:2-amino-4-hydroxy-6-hydroxymethyldihydropteridine diphosphokinase